MAVHGRYTRVLLDEFDFSGVNNTAEVSISSESVDVTTFQATGKEYVVIGAEGSIMHNGYYTGSTSSDLETALQSRMSTTTSTAAVLLGTSASSYPAYVVPNTGTKDMTIAGATGAVVTLNGSYHSGGGIKRGIVLYRGTLSATGATTAVSMGSAGSTGGPVYLFVQAITGTATSAAVQFQSSASEGGTYITRATATFSAVGAHTDTMPAVVGAWMKLNVSTLGGATNFTVVAIACVNGVTM